tara:strand:+ start:89 stop:280 length:192 start_codon:yes stop_codon:yes gene_type:complete
LTKKNYLEKLSKTKKPFIVYKTVKGFDLYTNFSKKIILTNKNIHNFIGKIKIKKKDQKIQIYI